MPSVSILFEARWSLECIVPQLEQTHSLSDSFNFLFIILEKVELQSVEYAKYKGIIINSTNLGQEVPTENEQIYIQVDKESILKQLYLFLKQLENE